MKKELIKLANHLDRIGRVKEANYIDNLLKEANSRDLFYVKMSFNTQGGFGEGLNKYTYITQVYANLLGIKKTDNKNLLAYLAVSGGADDFKSLRMLFLYNGDIMSLSEKFPVLKRIYSVELEEMLRGFELQIDEVEKIALDSKQYYEKLKSENDDDIDIDSKLNDHIDQGWKDVREYYDDLKTKAGFFDLRQTDDLNVIIESSKKLLNYDRDKYIIK